MPELPDVQAVNVKYEPECGCQGPACGCPTAVNPNLAATCNAERCQEFDVRLEATMAACESDVDCRLRVGAGCCESCGGSEWELIALGINGERALQAAVCGSSGPMCPDCVPSYPPGKVARCVKSRCQVVDR